ncbi:MAG: septum site-determining protein MinC [Cellvibrionaceae bacterium]
MSTDLRTADEVSSRTPSFRLKGGLFPMTLLEVTNTDLNQLRQDLIEKVAQAPAFFQQAPAVISLAPATEHSVALKAVTQLCLEFGLIVVALRGGSEQLQQQAGELNLALMPASRERPASSALPSNQDASTEAAANESHQSNATADVDVDVDVDVDQAQDRDNSQRAEEQLELSLLGKKDDDSDEIKADVAPTSGHTHENPSHDNACKIISTPVRSGQQIYAAGGDLIVLAPVSAGAELLADGNIHVYGALRGRALAGVKGNTKARVFCQSQEAELISIAGCFMVDEDLRSDHWKQAVQVTLSEDRLTIQSLI